MKTGIFFIRDGSGASAVEFAIIAPLFLLILFTMIAYGIYFGAAMSVQEIAADAARYSVAGVNDGERTALARQYIETATRNDPLIDPSRLEVTVRSDPQAPEQFMVSLSYDARSLPIWNLFSFPLPAEDIKRFATIRIGGV